MVNPYFNPVKPICINECFTILMAYILPVILWHAFLTIPNEPDPNGLLLSAMIKS